MSNDKNCIQDWDDNMPDAWHLAEGRLKIRLEILQLMGGDFLLCCALYKDTEIAHIARGQPKSWVNESLGRLRLTGLKVTPTIGILKGWDVFHVLVGEDFSNREHVLVGEEFSAREQVLWATRYDNFPPPTDDEREKLTLFVLHKN